MTAKGVEDTAFYVYNRLVSLNEVGGEPGRFGLRPEAVHAYNRDRQARWPYALSPLSTHDTKRSEDVRARINVLSEMPEDWWAAVERWSRLNEPLRKAPGPTTTSRSPTPTRNTSSTRRSSAPGRSSPTGPRNTPTFVKRIQDYMLKALHEAKVHTSWINPNAEYDEAIGEFVGRILDEGPTRAFLDDFRAFHRRVADYGLYNSLSQTLLKLAVARRARHLPGDRALGLQPGGPRQPPAGRLRAPVAGCSQDLRSAAASAGGDLRAAGPATWSPPSEDGRIKLYVTHRSLDRAGATTPGSSPPASTSPWPPRARRPRTCSPSPAATARPPPSSRCPAWSPGCPPSPAARRSGAEAWAGHPARPDRPRPGPPLAQRSSPARLLTPEVRDGQPSLRRGRPLRPFPRRPAHRRTTRLIPRRPPARPPRQSPQPAHPTARPSDAPEYFPADIIFLKSL